MQELASYKTAIDANAAKTFLESQGIEVHIRNERVADADPILGLAIGVKLFVKETDLESARKLLNENRT